MLPFAVFIDLIGIILVFFLLDDFWITDIVAWTFIGGWSFFRSQITPDSGGETTQIPSSGGKKELAGKIKEVRRTAEQTKKARRTARLAKWGKRIKWLEFIPYVGALPFWTISVYMTIKYS